MGEKPQKIQEQKQISLGVLAHVDAGKTTLSEGLLFKCGRIRKIGRVDHKDAYLDTYELERERGITIFSKQAVFSMGAFNVTLLDTPGHVDFSAEMERTLQVLDYAILVINGADGVQGHTQTLWRLLEQYKIPTFLFVNKMDQDGTDREGLLQELKKKLSGNCVDFGGELECHGAEESGKAMQQVDNFGKTSGEPENESGVEKQMDHDGRFADSKKSDHINGTDDFLENIAVCDENLLENFLETGIIKKKAVVKLILERKLFPCFFGSALKMEGVDAFIRGMETYMAAPVYPSEFGAKIFKIARDDQGNRLTYMKITGGSLKVKETLTNAGRKGIPEEEIWEEKVDQIRIYSGAKFEMIKEAEAGTVCAVTGLTETYPGEGLGIERESVMPVLEPVLNYQIILPEGCDAHKMLKSLKELEEEEPQLHIMWDEQLGEIHAMLMGEVQIEILKHLIWERFHVAVEFGTGNIVYKETIAAPVEGVGHFEPLRHYAEVHLLLEPGERGSGLCFQTDCSEDILDKNWQRLILTHLAEREHRGVLTGSAITDMKITVVSGRAHPKHTEGGDFRQATYRAIRQGLMEADSVLLEPYYAFRLEIPEECLGRAMHDMEQRNSRMDAPQIENGMALLTGSGPVSKLSDYQKELNTYAKGRGKFFCTLQGYEVCQNQDEVVEAIGYQPEADLYNTSDSVFCAHGAGYLVPWYEVKEHMHMPSVLEEDGGGKEERIKVHRPGVVEDWVDTDEIDAILEKTFYANRQEGKRKNGVVRKRKAENNAPTVRTYYKPEKLERYLLVDGYNVIYAWKDLHELAEVNLDGARGKLQDILCNYQGIFGGEVIVVFDAYRLTGHKTEQLDYHNIHIVFTKEAETADQYIERFAHEHHNHYDVTVATSDGLEQMIIRGQDCKLISAREFEQEVKRANSTMWDNYRNGQNIF